jgi:hypothetical protein
MSDAVWIKLIDNVPLTLTAIGSMYAAFRSWQNGKKTDAAISHAEVAATKTDEVQKRQIEIKSQTDGQLSQALEEAKRWREFANVLMAIMSAREGKPITNVSQVVRADDPLVKRSGNGPVAHERRATDPKPSEKDEPKDD